MSIPPRLFLYIIRENLTIFNSFYIPMLKLSFFRHFLHENRSALIISLRSKKVKGLMMFVQHLKPLTIQVFSSI